MLHVRSMKHVNQSTNDPLDSKKRQHEKENVPPIVDALLKNDECNIRKTMCNHEVSDAKVFLLPADIVSTGSKLHESPEADYDFCTTYSHQLTHQNG